MSESVDELQEASSVASDTDVSYGDSNDKNMVSVHDINVQSVDCGGLINNSTILGMNTSPHEQADIMVNSLSPSESVDNQSLGHEGGNTPSFGGKVKYHLYCPVCGHEWYSPCWDNYCPQSGCTGRPKPM